MAHGLPSTVRRRWLSGCRWSMNATPS
jgi:hypothetical protein